MLFTSLWPGWHSWHTPLASPPPQALHDVPVLPASPVAHCGRHVWVDVRNAPALQEVHRCVPWMMLPVHSPTVRHVSGVDPVTPGRHSPHVPSFSNTWPRWHCPHSLAKSLVPHDLHIVPASPVEQRGRHDRAEVRNAPALQEVHCCVPWMALPVHSPIVRHAASAGPVAPGRHLPHVPLSSNT